MLWDKNEDKEGIESFVVFEFLGAKLKQKNHVIFGEQIIGDQE